MKIVFAGNCQAYALYYLYERFVGNALGQTVGWVDAWNEHRIDDWRRELADADLVIIQLFSNRTRVPVGEMCDSVKRILFPDIRGSFLWPYGNVARIDNPQPAFKGGGPYDPEVGDAYLNRLIAEGIAPETALRLYRDLDVAKEVNLDRVFELTLYQQRQRDQVAGFAFADKIETRFRQQKLFNTQGHLTLPLFHQLAAEVFGRMGLDDTQICDFRRQVTTAPFEPYHDAPIHPNVAAHYGLTYVDENSTYHHVQEGKFTFDEWVMRYLRNEWSPELHEGSAAFLESDLSHALALLERGLVQAPRSAVGFDRKSRILSQLGRAEEAIDAAQQAVRLEPGDGEFLAHLNHVRSISMPGAGPGLQTSRSPLSHGGRRSED